MRRRVALIIETSSLYGRQLLAGVIKFMRLQEPWSVFLDQQDLERQPPQWLQQWRGDGILSRATTPALLAAAARTGTPLVELTDRFGVHDCVQVRSNDEAIGRLAAEHLLERGFTRFGFCGYTGEAWSRRRQAGFVQRIAQAAVATEPCAVYQSPWHGSARLSWDDEQRQLRDWVRSMTPPLAIMACNDLRGQQVIDACAALQLAVPEEAAVIGVDDDAVLCRLCSPPLSSVVPNAELVGFRGAEMLSDLMHGRKVGQTLLEIDPLRVSTRQSTDVVAIEDRDTAAALNYIRQHACEGISVSDVVRNSPVSRSTLERQMRKYLQRTPQAEIRHVQIKRACELLLTTDSSVEQIAAACGFRHPEYLQVVFKRITGTTPSRFRREAGR